MSRIQNLLNKAERDGTVRRTRSLVEDGAVSAPPQAREAGRPRLDIVEPPRPETARSIEPPAWTPPEPPPAGPGRLDPHLIAALAPTSLAAEQYRSLRARIRRA